MEDTSIIVATRAQMDAIDLDATLLSQLAQFDAAEMKWLDPVKLAQLEAVLGGPPVMEIIDRSSSEFVSSSDDGEAFIQTVCPELTERLAAVDDGELDEIARRWGATEELASYPVDELGAFLRTFVVLAREAGTGERQLFQVIY